MKQEDNKKRIKYNVTYLHGLKYVTSGYMYIQQRSKINSIFTILLVETSI